MLRTFQIVIYIFSFKKIVNLKCKVEEKQFAITNKILLSVMRDNYHSQTEKQLTKRFVEVKLFRIS